MKYRPWSDEDLDELSSLLEQNMDIDEIAKVLGREVRSVEYEIDRTSLRRSVSGDTVSKDTGSPVIKNKQRKESIEEAAVTYLDQKQAKISYDNLWDSIIKFQHELHKVNTEQSSATIKIDTNKWIGVAFQGDLHLGNMATDYETLLYHKDLIETTKNLFVVINGDYCDNYISGSHVGGAFEALFPPKTQKDLAKNYIESIKDKVLALVAGCFMKGSKVTMGDGTEKNIEDIQVGDMVMSEDGIPQRITRTYANYHNGGMRKIYAEGNLEPLHVTWDHKCLVLKRNKTLRADGYHVKKYSFIKENLETVEARNVEVGDYVCTPIPRSKKGTPSTKFKNYDYEIDIPFLRLAGYWLAEGWYKKEKDNITGLQLAFHIDEQKYAEEVLNIAEIQYGIPCNVNERHAEHCRTITINDKQLASMFMELFGEYSDKKYIHPEILSQPPVKLCHLVNTFGNGDGCLRKQNGTEDITLTTVSREVANGLSFALTKSGIFHSLRQQKRPDDKLDDYQINFGEESLAYLAEVLELHSKDRSIKANASRIQKRGKEQRSQKVYDGYIWKRVTKIDIDDFDGFVYNVTVDKTHNLIVHNQLHQNCHDLWSLKIDDFDLTEYLAKHGQAVYLGSGGDLYLNIGSVTYKIKMRHKYRFNSADNPTSTVKKMFEKEGGFDVGVCSHNHISAIEESLKTGLDGTLKRIFIRAGSYKPYDRYSKQMGFSAGSLSVPVVLFNPSERDMRGFENLEEGIEYLNYLNGEK